MKRALTIWIYTVFLFTLGSATIYVVSHWNEPSQNGCMLPLDGPTNTILGGIIFGIVGFIVSLIVGPTVAVTDYAVNRCCNKLADQKIQAQNSAFSLLRASSAPPSLQKRELLRASKTGQTTPPQELLRAGEMH